MRCDLLTERQAPIEDGPSPAGSVEAGRERLEPQPLAGRAGRVLARRSKDSAPARFQPNMALSLDALDHNVDSGTNAISPANVAKIPGPTPFGKPLIRLAQLHMIGFRKLLTPLFKLQRLQLGSLAAFAVRLPKATARVLSELLSGGLHGVQVERNRL